MLAVTSTVISYFMKLMLAVTSLTVSSYLTKGMLTTTSRTKTVTGT